MSENVARHSRTLNLTGFAGTNQDYPRMTRITADKTNSYTIKLKNFHSEFHTDHNGGGEHDEGEILA